MKLKIRSIHEKGKANEEYVLLDVVEDCDVGKHGLADTTYTASGKVSNRTRHFYWFPDKLVKKGELIVLRTGVGTNDSYKNTAGTTVHRFFWGIKSAVWNDDGDVAVLFEISRWAHAKA